MNQSMGMADFFSMEAGDYLERLDSLVSAGSAPDPREFIRLSRALRGSAIMAGQQAIANVAAGLESLSRGLDEAQIGWGEGTRQLAIRAVDDMKVLVRAVPGWGSAEEARAQAIANELEHAAGRATVPRRVEKQDGLDSGTRAFIAREGAAVGSALDRAARTLSMNPGSLDALESVLRAMQPLRGIASLSDLPPLPDLLEGIERAIQEVSNRRDLSQPPTEIFDAAARAVSRAAQEIATSGMADAESPEASAFAEMLGGLFDTQVDVVPIEQLYHDDQGPHVVDERESPTDVPLGQLELVSHAEYLRQFADDLEKARSTTQRTLRTHALAPTLRALSSGAGGGLTAEFARAARDAVARGAAVQDPHRFAAQLREAGTVLSGAAQGGGGDVSTTLQTVIDALEIMAISDLAAVSPTEPSEPVIPVSWPAAQVEATAPVDTAPDPMAAPPAAPVVEPVESTSGWETIAVTAPLSATGAELASDEPPEPPAVEPPAVADPAHAEFEPATVNDVAPAGEDASLAGGYAEYHRLEQALGGGDGLLKDLLDGLSVSEAPGIESASPNAHAVEPAAARTTPGFDPVRLTTAPAFGAAERAMPSSEERPPSDQRVAAVADGSNGHDESEFEEFVPISQFCYSGTPALRRAISLRDQVRTALANQGDTQSLAELVEEIFDLVQLGIHRPT